MTPDRVDFDDTDRLDALAARAERRVPRYPDPAPVSLQEHRWLIRLWAWCRAARLFARDFLAELRQLHQDEVNNMLDPRKLASMPRADLEAAYVRLDAQSRQVAPAPLKDGWKTTEFWSTILGQVSVLVAIVLAFQHPEVSTERLIVILIVAAGGGAALAGWYTGKRTDLKQTEAIAKADAAAGKGSVP